MPCPQAVGHAGPVVDAVLVADAAGTADEEVVAKLTALGMWEQEASDAIEQIR